MVNRVRGQKGQPGKRGNQPVATAVAVDGVGNRRRRDQRPQKAEQPPVPVGIAEKPDERRGDHVEERRVVAGIKRIDVGIAVRKLSLAEEDRVDQLEALALIVVEGEADQVGGIDDVDRE